VPEPTAPADTPAPPAVESTPGAPAADETRRALEAQVAEMRDRMARARADYDNLQKRVARDAAAERERAKARVLEALLPLHELSRMAAHQAELHPGPVSEGVVLLAREFTRLLEREGLQPIDSVGVPFDPAFHEAVAQEAVDGMPAGAVARVIQAGYRLDGKVLRFAKVAVAAPGAPSS
jgi:molecular chaperone GrpE